MSAIFSCNAASQLASEAQEHPLGWRKRVALTIHMSMCSACRSYVKQIVAIDRLFRTRAQGGNPDLPTSSNLDAAAKERIRNRLRQKS